MNNSKIAAGPLSGNGASNRGQNGPSVYLNDRDDSDGNQGPSDTDEDDEEHLDCVHDIHGDGEEADVEEIDGDDEFSSEHQVNLNDVGLHEADLPL